MNISAVIPWGNDFGEREKVWNGLHKIWASRGMRFIVARDPLFRNPLVDGGTHPFSVARAVNSGVRSASPLCDSFVVWGADHVPDFDAISWAAQRLNSGRGWTLMFDCVTGLNEASTNDFLAGKEVRWPRVRSHSPVAGIVAFTRDAFNRTGGFDERYEGWGYEDVDFMNRLHRDVQPHEPVYLDRPLKCLWHGDGEPAQRRNNLTLSNPNVSLFHSTWG